MQKYKTTQSFNNCNIVLHKTSICSMYSMDTWKISFSEIIIITRWLYCVVWTEYSIRLKGYLCTSRLLPTFDEA